MPAHVSLQLAAAEELATRACTAVGAAGLSGGAWSMDASNFQSGNSSPAVGLTVFAIIPAGLGDDMIERANAHVKRLQENGVYVPGASSERIGKPLPDAIDIPGDVFECIKDIIGES